MGPWGPKGPMPPRGHFWALWGPKGPTRGTGGLRGSPRSPPEAPGAFLEKPGFWPPGGLPARGKISHRKVSSKGSQPRRDPSRDLRLEKLVPQKIPSPDLSIKKNQNRGFFSETQPFGHRRPGEMRKSARCAGGGRRAAGGGRREVRIKSGATAAHTHTHTWGPWGPPWAQPRTAIPRCGRTSVICASRIPAAQRGPHGAPRGPRGAQGPK